MKLSLRLYTLAIMLMPLTYATKFALGLNSITWIDPTLILSLAIFLLIWPSFKPPVTVVVVVLAFASAGIGFVFLNISGSAPIAVYAAIREPFRLLLNVMFFWVTVHFLRSNREETIKWLSISVIVQLLIAVYIWLAAASIMPLFEPAAGYARYYAIRQVVWFGSTPVMRLGGTFLESPPFGLFMISTFLVFSLLIYRERSYVRWLRLGWVAALIGTLASFSDQILLALIFVLVLAAVQVVKGRAGVVTLVLGVILLAAISPYFLERITSKIDQVTSLKAYNAMGQSGGERIFHSKYALNLMIENPQFIPLGIGPGRYGDYVSQTGVFPSTVTPQVTPVEWLVEHGLLGLIAIVFFLWTVGRMAFRAYGVLGLIVLGGLLLANLFQGNWKWESWFFALAFLFTSGSRGVSVSVHQKA